MGRLRHLELDNFKSYSGKQVVGPFDDFTCVIGPNGAGKSNLMDAVSFVLGVQSKHLRSSSLKELLYRADADSTPASKASVRLIYELSKDEIKGKAAGTKIVFARHISSNGDSKYLLDDREVSFDDYEARLTMIGVLSKVRNFLVFQGDIESVASKTPKEITVLLEQISGSEALREEYTRLYTEKNDAEETALFSLQKRKMYATQKKEIKDQKDEADIFRDKREELDELRSEQILMKVWGIKQGLDLHSQEVQHNKREVNDMNQQEKALNEELQNGKKRLAKVSKNLVSSEKERAVKAKIVTTLVTQLDETRARMTGLRKRIAELKKATTSVQLDRRAQEESLKELRKDMAELEASERDLERELQDASDKGFDLDEDKVREYARLREEVSAQNAKDLASEHAVDQEIRSKKLQIERLDVQLRSTRNEEDNTANLIQEYQTRVEKLSAAVTTGKHDVESLKRQRDENQRKISASEARASVLSQEHEAVLGKLRNVGEDRFRHRQEDKLSAAIVALQNIFPNGVHGKLVDLIKPIQKKYGQAIATAAGKHMDAIVVESKAIAQECISYLKDQRAGACVFLPLNNIEVKAVSDRLRSLAPQYKAAFDLVECDDKFKPAVSYALGSTLVADSLNDAQELCFTRKEKVKVVTLQGAVISRNGAMTGGSISREGQDRWEEKEVERLRAKKVELEEAMADNKHSAPGRQAQVDLEMRIRTLQTRIQFSEADRKVTQEKLTQLAHQNNLKHAFAKETQKNADTSRKDLLELEKKQMKIQQQISTTENSIFAAFSEEVGVNNIREYERKQLRTHDDLQKRGKQIAEQKASLNAQLQYESKRDFKGIESRLLDQLNSAEEEIVAQDDVETKLLSDEEIERSELSRINEGVESLRKQRTEVVTEVKQLQVVMNTLLERRDNQASKLAGEEILLERMKTKLHDLLQRAQVDEISLPTIAVDEDDESASSGLLLWSGSQSQSAGNGKSKKRGDSASDATKLAMVDLSSMDEKLQRMSRSERSDREEELSVQVDALKVELDAIRPNMHAEERYDGVVGKLHDCEEELDGVRNNAKDLNARFDDVKKRRQTLFQECYQHVSESLQVIYRDLTKSSKHPTGGTAYLTLDNTEEPYNGGTRFTAMPPMKRFRDMEQLSGGEKTMAALALLFSIHSYRQAPFFVLDEVDAALDNVNVKKICNYIQQRSREFQCVVISLKDIFFEHADSLVGVAKDVEELSSKLYTLDLKTFDEPTYTEKVQAEQVYASPSRKGSKTAHTPQSGAESSTRGTGSTLKRKVSPASASKRGRPRAVESSITEDFDD